MICERGKEGEGGDGDGEREKKSGREKRGREKGEEYLIRYAVEWR